MLPGPYLIQAADLEAWNKYYLKLRGRRNWSTDRLAAANISFGFQLAIFSDLRFFIPHFEYHLLFIGIK
jgi:hypothetical protein